MKQFLKIIALSQMAGGVLLLLVVLTAPVLHTIAPAGFFVMALVVGVFSLVVGRWLWRGDPRGRVWSLPLQAVQIVRVTMESWTIKIIIGVQLDLNLAAERLSISAGASGTLDASLGRGGAQMLTINVFALAAFLVLLRAQRPAWEEEPQALEDAHHPQPLVVTVDERA